jgi:hypothetical protein
VRAAYNKARSLGAPQDYANVGGLPWYSG